MYLMIWSKIGLKWLMSSTKRRIVWETWVDFLREQLLATKDGRFRIYFYPKSPHKIVFLLLFYLNKNIHLVFSFLISSSHCVVCSSSLCCVVCLSCLIQMFVRFRLLDQLRFSADLIFWRRQRCRFGCMCIPEIWI